MRRPVITALEPRRLLSKSFFIGDIELRIDGAELHIIGTGGPDDFSVEIEGNILSLKNSEATGGQSGGADMLPDPLFPAQSPDVPIRRVKIHLGAGSDKIVFSIAPAWEDTARGDLAQIPNTYRIFPTIRGGDGDDEMVVSGNFVFAYGDSGNDLIEGGKRVFGGEGNDTLVGGASAKYGGPDNDILSGTSSFGSDGRSLLDGGEGNDTLTGGRDADTLIVSAGDDMLDGSDGRDLVWLTDEAGGIVDLLSGRATTASGRATLADLEDVLGGPGDDQITGSNERNVLFGGAGNDTLFGLDGKDTLVGGFGRDLLDGGDNGDLLLAGLDGEGDVIRGGGGFDVALLDEQDTAQELERHRTSVAELLELLDRT